ncbi:hypothetical protein Fcan01_17256 [Folsomia candida]|uniref:Uncharacterized protein n=1 Tax=Folsomia candida TaxID=158441 RepID=A0A226DUB5_FOLCA|nr:hypothetical protein Fcan01_17256 [Folsomia candida]
MGKEMANLKSDGPNKNFFKPPKTTPILNGLELNWVPIHWTWTWQQESALVHSAKNDASVTKKPSSGFCLHIEMVILCAEFRSPDYEKWSKLGTKYLENLWCPPPSTTYGPLIRHLSDWCMMSCAYPIVFSGNGDEVVFLKGPRQLGLLTFSVFTMALNCAVFMLHFLKKSIRMGSTSSRPVWEEAMIDYFFAVITITFSCQIITLWRKTECKFLVRMAFEMEKYCREIMGASNYTIKFLVWFCELVKITFFLPTLAVCGLTVILPCTPPSLGNILLSDCQAGWERPDGISVTQKILLGLFEGYTWYLASTFCVFFHGGVLIYTAEMMRLWVTLVER